MVRCADFGLARLLRGVRDCGWGSAASGHGPGVSGHPAGVVEGATEQHLDVGVDAAKLVGGPSGQGVVDRRIDPKQHLFALTAHV